MDILGFVLGVVTFPAKGSGWFPFIGKLAYLIIGGIHGGGKLNYGVAIIFFTVVLKLILLPIDFANRFFTKKNQKFMEKMKPEEDAIKEQYKDDPMKMMRARSALFKKHGYKGGWFAIFTLVNLFITLAVFMTIYSSLRMVATYNVKATVQELETVYYDFRNDPEKDLASAEFKTAINDAYKKHSVSFLWIKNIWHEDTSFSSSSITQGEYLSYSKVEITQEELDTAKETDADITKTKLKTEQYNLIYKNINSNYKRSWNGLFILVILAGASSWLSAFISAKTMKKMRPLQPAQKKGTEPIPVYSTRDAKEQSDPKVPNFDPATVGKTMMFILPAIMVFFTMSSTAALAIYIITNSLLSTAQTLTINYPVEKLLKWDEKRKKVRGGETPDQDDAPVVINPHTKYFKGRSKK
jgi:YidC/Oxa1 family membrane protein insertase